MGNCTSCDAESDRDRRKKKNAYDLVHGDEKEEQEICSYKKKATPNGPITYTQSNNVVNKHQNNTLNITKDTPISHDNSKLNEVAPGHPGTLWDTHAKIPISYDNLNLNEFALGHAKTPISHDNLNLNEFALGLAKKILTEIKYKYGGSDPLKIRVEENLLVRPTEEADPNDENLLVRPTEETDQNEDNLLVRPTEKTDQNENNLLVRPTEETDQNEDNLLVRSTEEADPNEDVRISLIDINNVSKQNTDKSRDINGEQDMLNNLSLTLDQTILYEFALKLAKQILSEAVHDSKDDDMIRADNVTIKADGGKIGADDGCTLKRLGKSYSISDEDLRESLPNDVEIHNILNGNLSQYCEGLAFTILTDTRVEILLYISKHLF